MVGVRTWLLVVMVTVAGCAVEPAPNYSIDDLIKALSDAGICSGTTEIVEFDENVVTGCLSDAGEHILVVSPSLTERAALVNGQVESICSRLEMEMFPQPVDKPVWYVYGDTWAVTPTTSPSLPDQIPPIADSIRSAKGGALNEFTCEEYFARVNLMNEKLGIPDTLPDESVLREYDLALLNEPGADLSIVEP